MSGNIDGKDKVRIFEVEGDCEGNFLSRPNRFTGIVEIEGRKETVHVHDPGRLKELLYHGNRVLLKYAYKPNRKTKWELIAARYGDMWDII